MANEREMSVEHYAQKTFLHRCSFMAAAAQRGIDSYCEVKSVAALISAGRPGKSAATEKMKMDVKHFLPGIAITVYD